MKNIVRIDLSWKRIMRVVEEQAAYYAAKSGDIDTTYINGLLTEPDKYHLGIYMREALDTFDVISEDYPHTFGEAEISLSMPMNFDETRADRLRTLLWQFVANHILTAWMSYIGKKNDSYTEKMFSDEYAELQRKMKALLNHRRRFSRADFEDSAYEPHKGHRIPVY